MGLFDNEDEESVMERARKQKIRSLLGRIYQDGERAIRSLWVDDGNVYVDVFNKANIFEVNMLIRAEQKRIAKSKKVISSLKRVKRMILDGQLTLDEYYKDAL